MDLSKNPFNSNTYNLKYDKLIDKLRSYGYTLEGENLLVQSIATGKKFNPRTGDKEEIYKILIKIFHAMIQEQFHIKKVKYFVSQNTKTYIFSSFYYLNNSKLFLIIPDFNMPCGIINKSSLFYDGLNVGSTSHMIQTAIDENYCVMLFNPYKQLYKNDRPINQGYYEYCLYAFKEYIDKKAELIKDFIIVGFGLAGVVICKLIRENIYKKNLRNNTKK